MIITDEQYIIDDKLILLRNAYPKDAEMLSKCVIEINDETRFLTREHEELAERYTVEKELEYINKHLNSSDSLFILAFVNGEFAGNCSFGPVNGGVIRCKHRTGIGISIYQKYTNLGIGTRMLKCLIRHAKEVGYEQMELNVVGNNERAKHVYQKLGFVECGRLPNAFKYKDGTYQDSINMVLNSRHRNYASSQYKV